MHVAASPWQAVLDFTQQDTDYIKGLKFAAIGWARTTESSLWVSGCSYMGFNRTLLRLLLRLFLDAVSKDNGSKAQRDILDLIALAFPLLAIGMKMVHQDSGKSR